MNPDEILLATLELKLDYATCGLCCFPGNQPEFEELKFFPSNLKSLGLEDILADFMADTKRIFLETGTPLVPCSLIPHPIPYLYFSYYDGKRKSKLDELVKEYNQKRE